MDSHVSFTEFSYRFSYLLTDFDYKFLCFTYTLAIYIIFHLHTLLIACHVLLTDVSYRVLHFIYILSYFTYTVCL